MSVARVYLVWTKELAAYFAAHPKMTLHEYLNRN